MWFPSILTWHESSLLEPEDGGEGPREEDSLHACVRDHALGEGRGLGVDPLEGPPDGITINRE